MAKHTNKSEIADEIAQYMSNVLPFLQRAPLTQVPTLLREMGNQMQLLAQALECGHAINAERLADLLKNWSEVTEEIAKDVEAGA